MSTRLQIEIAGQVQGVGFRPYVYRIAKQLGLTGFVQNNGKGVLIEVQGEAVQKFIKQLRENLPPLAKIDSIETKTIASESMQQEFIIAESKSGNATTKISPDVSICADCLQEFFDPSSRFYNYPFINCTNCGPRLTITCSLPYDRPQTAMAQFPLCADCERDYNDPTNRRYHAQPIACAKCGPTLSLPISEIIAEIRLGKIVAVKGLGGYQLVCDACNEEAVSKLRARKNRYAKPFAIMVADLKSVAAYAECSQEAAELLVSHARPIVLLPKRNRLLPEVIAPGLSHLGIMLPYTPLHYLFFSHLVASPNVALVVTSANPGGNPLLINDELARTELAAIADIIVSYNREIITRVDDSVLRIVNHKPCFIRRARSYVPNSIPLAQSLPCILAVGGHLKNTICITRENEAFVSQHIGDLENAATIQFFHETLNYLLKYLNVKPEYTAHDLHPDFYTTRFAQEYGIPAIAVQHHYAHIAAVAAEHHVQEPALGLALDGYGYGENGAAWGGELFLYHPTCSQHLAHLKPLQQPGGEVVARQPWRMAASVMHQLKCLDKNSPVFTLLEKNIHSPLTSSCGRLFDAASALLGVCMESQYEGQAAMLLESLVTTPKVITDGWIIENNVLNLLPLMTKLLACDRVEGANIFHGTLAMALAEWVYYHAKKLVIKTVLASGGCFSNKVLLENFTRNCKTLGLVVLYSKMLPPNDGGISLGQAWAAGNKIAYD